MSAPSRLAAFAATLAVSFGAGALAGGAIDPRGEQRTARAEAGGAHGTAAEGHQSMSSSTHAGSHGTGGMAAHPVRGLAVAENGLRVVVDDPELRRGRNETLRFSIVNDRGEIVRDFDIEHTKRLHLIVARRDLTGFQHLHPEQHSDGSWGVPLRLEDAGSYRMFADFSRKEKAYTLASDLRVDGAADLKTLPAPAPDAVADGGYDVHLDPGVARPGEEADLRFTISSDGRPVDTEPYLGAGGHLVALREGDLGFLHVHPTTGRHEGETSHEQEGSIGFMATFPTEGRYRLFLQFQAAGRVQTVAFTQVVE